MGSNVSNFLSFKDSDFSAQGTVALEGRFVIEKAVRAGVEVEWLACAPEREREWVEFAAGRFPVAALSHSELSGIAGYQFHRGELAVGKRPRIASAKEFLGESGVWGGFSGGGERGEPGARGPAGILCLWNISDPSNVGGMIRSAAALGAEAVALGPGTADPFYRKAVRASMGNVFSVRLFRLEESDIPLLRGAGVTTLAATLSERAEPLGGAPRPPLAKRAGTGLAEESPDRERELGRERPLALFVGNEGYGLPPSVAGACDGEVAIPMAAGVDSLNVGVAAGILMYELFGGRLNSPAFPR